MKSSLRLPYKVSNRGVLREVRRAVYRVHALSRVPCACVLGIQQIETCAVAEIAKPGTHTPIHISFHKGMFWNPKAGS